MTYAAPLTQEEANWIKVNPVVTVGTFNAGFPPFEDTVNNRLTGIGPDILNEITKRLGLSVKLIRYPTRQDLVLAIEQGKVDIMMNAAPNFTDAKYLRYSKPYANNDLVIVTTRDNRFILDHADLVNTKLVAVKGTSEGVLIPEVYPTSKLQLVSTQSAALDAVEKGEADAFIGNRHAIQYYISINKSDNFRIVGNANLPLQSLRFAFPGKLELLSKAFDKTLDDIGFREQQAVFTQWVGGYPVGRGQQERINLTIEQINLLNQLPSLNVSNLEPYKPFSFRNQQGEPSGLVEEYFELVRRQLQFKAKRISVRNLNDLTQLAQDGEIDLIPGLPPTEERKRYLVFSEPYAKFPLVIITRKETSNIQDIENLGKARVAVSENVEPIPTLLNKNKGLTLVHVSTADEGLYMLANHKVDAYIGNLVVSDRIITESYPNLLKVAAPTGYYVELAIAVAKKYAYVMPLINQALENITPARRELIRNTWFPITFHEDVTWQVILEEALPALIVMLLIMTILIIAYLRLCKEIRQRKIAQDMLANQLTFQHALLETIPFPVLGKDSQNRYIAANGAFEKLTGHKASRILGKLPEECDNIDTMLSLELTPQEHAAILEEVNVHHSLCYTNSQGEQREGLFWLKPFFSTHGELGGSVAVLVDVTDIRQSESRALRSEALLTNITESLPVTVFQFCLSASGEMCFTYVAGAPVATFGLSAESMMSDHDSFYRLVHTEDQHVVREAFLKMQGTLLPFQVEFRMSIKGQTCWIRASTGRGNRAENGDVFWGGYFEDITETRRQKRILHRAKTEAETAAREKASFLATMSHEIRTPVHGILGWLELLEKSTLCAEQHRMLNMVQSSATHLTQVIDDILDFSKLEAGQVSLEYIVIDIRSFLSELMQTVSLQATKKNLKLGLTISHQVAGQLVCDPVRLRQILMNFLSNSLKFTQSGQITLHLSLLQQQKNGQKVRFSVSDTGIGIPVNLQNKLFSPFKQAEASTTRRFGGTGLGLAISKGLAQQMNGQLAMISAPGEGTTINFDVAFNSRPTSAAHPEFSATTAAICSDDIATALALEEMLLALGISATRHPATVNSLEVVAAGDFIFIDEQASARDNIPLACGKKVITLSRNSASADEPLNERHLVISSNPLSWERLTRVCRYVLESRELSVISPAPVEAERGGQSGTQREAALRNGSLILVAEDHPISRELIQHQLQMLGYCFDIVEDGRQALQAIESTDYGLAIVDCHMPYIDGLELSRQVRQREQDRGLTRLTIVALTAGVLEGQAEECIAAGMDSYLRKPIDMQGLQSLLEDYLPKF